VLLNGAALGPAEFRWQREGDDVILWINRTLAEDTSVEVVPA
jgi:hypothetical protein